MPIKTDIKKEADRSFEIQIIIPARRIKEKYQKILREHGQEAKIKGFRKGQAPLDLVEKKIGKDSIYQQLIQKIISETYSEAIKKHDLRPIIPPKISLVSAKEGKDWKIKITSCELPEIKTDQLKKEVRELNAKSKIWTPKKGEKPTKNQEPQKKEQRIQEVINTIVKTTKIILPKTLIDYEMTRKLSGLIEELQKVGLKIEQYLSSNGITLEQLKAKYRREIEASWKIDLVLEKIADENKIVVSGEEIDRLTKANTSVNKNKVNPYLASKLLRRQKTLEYLVNL